MIKNVYSYFLRDLIKKQYISIITIVITFFIVFLLVLFNKTTVGYPVYRDEFIYMKCGVLMVRGIPPIDCNYEHPPLAKYIIGLFSVLGISIVLPVILYAISLLLFFNITKIVTSNVNISFLSSLFFGFDTLFVFVYMHYLLDPITLTFFLFTLYIGIKINKQKVKKQSYFILLGILMGLTLASKWQSAYLLFGLFIWLLYSQYKDNNFKYTSIFTTIIGAIFSYFLTFIADIQYGFYTIIYHNIKALNYMLYRHSFSPSIALIGIGKLILRAEIWHYAGILLVNPINNSLSLSNQSNLILNISSIIPPPGVFYISLYAGISSVLWYTLLPSFIYSLFLRLRYGLMKEYDIFFWLGGLSLINIINGPLDWYYIYTLPWLYVIFSAIITKKLRGYLRIIIVLLVLIQLVQFILFFSGMIPPRIDFVR